MLDPQLPITDYLDDFVHGVLDEQDAARVQQWLDATPGSEKLLAAAEQRKRSLGQLPPVEASERLIRTTLESIEMKATRRSRPVLRRVVQTFLALAATALIAIGGTHWYFHQLRPSPYSLRLLGQSRLLSGSDAALRLALVHQQTGAPLENVPVELALYDMQRDRTVTLASFKTTADGAQTPRFELPDWPQGDYLLRTIAQLPEGTEVLEEKITLTRSFKVMLSADKPLYQPGQIIHLRSLALRRPDLKPLATEAVLFEVIDSKGNVIFKERDTTSAYGIASADCQLAGEINTGEYQLKCTVGDTTSERTVKVEKYVLPKFKLSLDLDKSFYGPGETVKGTLSAKYFFGQPVAEGQVVLQARSTDVASQVIHEQELKADKDGVATFEFALPKQLTGTPQNQGNASFQLFATVTDSAGQVYTTMVSRLVTRDPLRLEIIPESGRLVQGVANKIYLHTSYADGKPAVCKLKVNALPEVQTNDLGVAVIELTPQDPQAGLTVAADDGEGHRYAINVQLQCGKIANDFVLRPDKAVYKGGETMRLTALGGGVEPVFIDLVKDGQTMLSQTIDLQGGRGTLDVDLPPELFGSVQLVAYRFDGSGLSARKSRLIFVHQAKELTIAAKFDQEEYRPGTQAKIKFTLADDAGKATPGAISLSAVDEAVFAVLNQRPGLEQAFFLAEQELLQPIYTIYPDWSPARETATDDSPRQLLEDAVFALTAYTADSEINIDNGYRSNANMLPVEATPPPPAVAGNAAEPVFTRPPLTLVANSYPDKVEANQAVRERGLQGVAIAWFVLVSLTFIFGVVMFAILMPKTFMVVMGSLVVLGMCGGGAALLIAPSQLRVDAVAMKAEMPFDVVGAPMAAMEGFPTPSEEPTLTPSETGVTSAPAAPPRVRQYFPETLLWQPELVTNDQGEAELIVDLADSITTWRLSANAVSGQGQLGDAQLAIKVFQPFFVDLNLPVALTRNDEVSVPVVVYNYLDKPQTVKLELQEADWFQLLGEDNTALQSLDLSPGEVRALSYRIKVLNVGYQQLKVTATGGGVADAIERSIDVIPNGTLVELVRNESLSVAGTPVEINVEIPENVVPGSVKAFVKFHPSGFSQLVEGLDAIFQMPYGCFEQTSSTTYPNVLALDYLRRTNKSQPQIEAKARQYIHTGYQRLVSFEVNGGGFDWFGNPPANRTLTAYGLLEFVDMAKVHDVDPALITRTRDWLMSQRKADGTWEPEPHMLNDGLASSVNRGDDARLAATAYIAWAVFHSSPPEQRSPNVHDRLQLTANYLLSHKPEQIKDPYILACVSMALAVFDPKMPELQRYLDQLNEIKQQDDKLCWWDQPADAARPFYGNGPAGQVETTAMATLAMLTAKAHGDTVNNALAWLVKNKDPQGTWHSTQATVLALKALIHGTHAQAEPTERKFEIRANGQLVQQLTIAADQADVIKQVDLSSWLTKVGESNSISIVESTDTATSFQAVFRHHIDVPAEAPQQEPLSIAIAYDRERLTVDETVTATATVVNNLDQAAPMVILDLPIPGGFTIERGELDELVGSRKIEKYQLTARQAIVYLRGLEPKHQLELRYRLKATMPVKVSVPRGEAYEYYNPQNRGASQPAKLEATIKT